MMKKEQLFASQGGNIILAQVIILDFVFEILCFRNPQTYRKSNSHLQIENEYGDYYEQAYGPGGKAYAMWAASMAVAQNTGVPWTMCQESDAPDPVVSSFRPMQTVLLAVKTLFTLSIILSLKLQHFVENSWVDTSDKTQVPYSLLGVW